jgi:dolichyl-diphosphooligosaccharide--protein glycosyltransferase
VDDDGSGTGRWFDPSTLALPEVDRRIALALSGALALVVAFRLVSLPSVYQDGAVVLTGNDPYFYRYLVEQLQSTPDVSPGSLPDRAANGEPLLVVTLWLASELVGGPVGAAGQVLAWYPVLAAVILGLLTYAMTTLATDDRRIGLAAVVLLAVVPGFALRTSLGFANHYAFDYVWLALTALSLTVVASERRLSRLTGLAAVGVGVGVAGQTLAWDASPLLLIALGGFLAADALVAVRNDRSPLVTGDPIIAGVGGATIVVWTVHSTLGWHTDLVASAPALLLVGGVVVVTAGEFAHRVDAPVAALAGAEVAAGVGGLGALAVFRPDYWSQIEWGVTRRLIRNDGIAEVQGLFGDSFGWLLLFGLVLVLALPYMAWGTHRALEDRRWLPPAVYGWYFFVLAALQVRFVGELAAFAALFAGLGFVHLAERVDVARRPAPLTGDRISAFSIPDSRQLGALAVLFLLVGGLGMLQVPVKVSQVTISEERHATAEWMADYSEERGWEYPENYVFSSWGENRHYNYFVSGESQSYAFARNNYADFVFGTNGSTWYDRLEGRTGFVVTTANAPSQAGTLGHQLHGAYGSRTANASALGHYRAVYTSNSGEYTVFTLVPGAVIQGTADQNETLTVTTSVSIEGTAFDYETRAETDANGNFGVRVPYPGEYDVGNRSVTVAESDVTEGITVDAG